MVPPSWLGGWLLVHFEAVDHEAEVWVDGQMKARHLGGYDAFSLRMPANREQFLLTLHVKDPTTRKANPVGKQVEPTRRQEPDHVFLSLTTTLTATALSTTPHAPGSGRPYGWRPYPGPAM